MIFELITARTNFETMAYVAFIEYNNERAVEKVSKTVTYSMEHESLICARLNNQNCDNFVKFIDLIESPDDGLSKLITKYVEGPTMFQYFTDDERFKTVDGCGELTSLITRALIAASIMNEQCKIVHNDLHQNNVIVTSTLYDYEVYIFPDGKEYIFETYGKYPVIIDMDMAYMEGMQRMLIPTFTYRYGVCCHDMDPLADARRLLSGLHNDIEASRVLIELLCLREVFNELNLTRFGWYKKGVFPDVYAVITQSLKDNNVKIDPINIDLFTSCIRLPLKRLYAKPKVFSPRQYITKLSYADIKNILDGNDVKKLTHRELCVAKAQFTQIIEMLNDLVYDEAIKFSNVMNAQIQKCRVKRVRDVVDLIYRPPAKVVASKNINVYDVENRINYHLTVSARDVRRLNNNRITFRELLSI